MTRLSRFAHGNRVEHRYLIALGSNRYHAHRGSPRHIIAAAFTALPLITPSRIIETRPLGPSLRRYANAAAIIETRLMPLELLAWLKAIEHDFGRRRSRRWGARILDLDIILWSGGAWASKTLTIPHPHYTMRTFVLKPLAQIAAGWRDPLTHLTVKQTKARLDRARPYP